MSKENEFDFTKARRIAPAERRLFRKAFKNTFGRYPPRRGRPPKGADKYHSIHIRLHPKALAWARTQAKQRGVGYQTVINEALLQRAA
ncbi:MAG: AT hook motif protein [Elusimicrobia bacterium]|nr:AT hook motif protein [Elusimicrobiota bacterium]